MVGNGVIIAVAATTACKMVVSAMLWPSVVVRLYRAGARCAERARTCLALRFQQWCCRLRGGAAALLRSLVKEGVATSRWERKAELLSGWDEDSKYCGDLVGGMMDRYCRSFEF